MLAVIAFAVITLAAIYAAAARDASGRKERRALVNEHDRERQMWRNERADLIGVADERVASLLERHTAELASARSEANVERAGLLRDMLAVSTTARADMVELVDTHETAIAELLDRFATERDQWRSQERELLNRVQHPSVMPTGTRPLTPPVNGSASDKARVAWGSVGRVAPLDVDELGDDTP